MPPKTQAAVMTFRKFLWSLSLSWVFVLDRVFSGQDLKEWLTAKEWPADAIEWLVERFEYCRLLLEHR